MPDPVIVSVRLAEGGNLPGTNIPTGQTDILIRFDHGEDERLLTSFYCDEITVVAVDLMGKTQAEALSHIWDLDLAYLRT